MIIGSRHVRGRRSYFLSSRILKGHFMNNPAGWYPQPDGQLRYWDGELWTEHFAPGAPVETTVLPLLTQGEVTGSSGRSFSKAASFGWGGLALVALIGALSSGLSGAAIMLGLFALVVGMIALARGHVSWARLGSRAAGGVAVCAAVVLLVLGGITAPPSTSQTSGSTTTSSDIPTTADAAAAAQAAAADAAATKAAASEAAAAAEKAAAKASAQATADSAAAAQALADAADAKKKADTTAAKMAEAAAAAKAQAAPPPRTAPRRAPTPGRAPAPDPAPTAKEYANCTAMHVDYKGGVALPGAVDKRASGGQAKHTPVYSTSLYNANTKSDRDNDQIACEA
jgi:hypothetical protein